MYTHTTNMQTRSNLILRDRTERIPIVNVSHTLLTSPVKPAHSYGLRSTHCGPRPSCVGGSVEAQSPKCGMTKPYPFESGSDSSSTCKGTNISFCIVDDNELYPIIDFDEASRCWKKNKVSKGNGTYTYRKR